MPVVYPGQNQKFVVESVATQTSDAAVNVVEKKTSDDWLAGYDERDAEREEDRIDVDDEPEDNESDEVMKRRKNSNYKKKRYAVEKEKPAVPSDETRVSIETDAPPPATPATSSNSTTPSTTTTTTTTTTSTPTSTDTAAEVKKLGPDGTDKKGSEKKAKGPEDSLASVKSNYFTGASDPGNSIEPFLFCNRFLFQTTNSLLLRPRNMSLRLLVRPSSRISLIQRPQKL